MAKIKNIPVYELQNPVNPLDHVIGTDHKTGKTKNFTLGQLMNQNYDLESLDLQCLTVVRRTTTDCNGNVINVPLQVLDVLQALINKVCNVQAIPVFDLLTTKTVSNQNPTINEVITYSISIKNRGNINATGVILVDVLPSGVTFVSSNTPAYNPTNGIWSIGNIDAGSTVTLNISVSVDSNSVNQTITNTIQSLSSDQDSDINSSGDILTSEITVVKQQTLNLDAGHNLRLAQNENTTTLSAISKNTNVSYLWELINGGSATIQSPTNKNTIVNNIIGDDLTFKVTMTDNINNNTVSDTLKTLKRENSTGDNPIVSLNDQTTSGSIVTIAGNYTDPQSLPNPQFQWTFETIGSSGTTYDMQDENAQNLVVNNLTTGVYMFKLTVTNTNGFIGQDIAIITVN